MLKLIKKDNLKKQKKNPSFWTSTFHHCSYSLSPGLCSPISQ